ncbi:hypothetical protein B1A99_24325 [Cohnella sp. CIP 111063]|nr:hypothetical protein B1A99_24325 [Cohnella sp. CIP 111063]
MDSQIRIIILRQANIAKIAKYAMENETFRKIVSTQKNRGWGKIGNRSITSSFGVTKAQMELKMDIRMQPVYVGFLRTTWRHRIDRRNLKIVNQ